MIQLLRGAAALAALVIASPVLAQMPMTPSRPNAPPAAANSSNWVQPAPRPADAAAPPPIENDATAMAPPAPPQRPLSRHAHTGHRGEARHSSDTMANALNRRELNRIRAGY